MSDSRDKIIKHMKDLLKEFNGNNGPWAIIRLYIKCVRDLLNWRKEGKVPVGIRQKKLIRLSKCKSNMESWKKRLDKDGEEHKKLKKFITSEDKEDKETNVFLNNACNLCDMMLHESDTLIFSPIVEEGEKVIKFLEDEQKTRKQHTGHYYKTRNQNFENQNFKTVEEKLERALRTMISTEKNINEWSREQFFDYKYVPNKEEPKKEEPKFQYDPKFHNWLKSFMDNYTKVLNWYVGEYDRFVELLEKYQNNDSKNKNQDKLTIEKFFSDLQTTAKKNGVYSHICGTDNVYQTCKRFYCESDIDKKFPGLWQVFGEWVKLKLNFEKCIVNNKSKTIDDLEEQVEDFEYLKGLLDNHNKLVKEIHKYMKKLDEDMENKYKNKKP
jgi:uncharacterized Zn finger protein (UPF0148 family)